MLPSSSSSSSPDDVKKKRSASKNTIAVAGETNFRILQVINGSLVILGKWFVGVLLRKLIDQSYQNMLSQPSDALLNFIFLYDLSFTTVAILSVVAFTLGSFTAALLGSWSYIRANNKGQQLRHDIVKRVEKSCSQGGSDHGGTNVTRVANDLLIQVKVIEDYLARDEKWILSNITVIILAIILSTIFLWYGGLLAMACIVLAEIFKATFESLRREHVDIIHDNTRQVNHRLLDIVKNGVKIKMMEQTHHELQCLAQLEHECEIHRRQDVRLLFFRDFFKHTILAIVPTMMAWITYMMIQSMESNQAIDLGSAVLAALVVLDECHKNMITLHFTTDRKAAAAKAQASIDAFTSSSGGGDGGDVNNNSRLKWDGVEQGKSADTASDLEMAAGHFSCPFQKLSEKEDYQELAFANLTYTYVGRDTPVFDGYNQTFQRGKIHGLVGESGAGKSTLLKMIASLIKPESGTLTHWKGMKVAYVNQDQKIFSRTIRENVSYGYADKLSDEKIWEALEAANIKDWVTSLPKGLDETLVGGEDSISGGQLQRLNLAHLFATCQDADVVVLDEVLSALDQESRDHLLESLETFLKGKTAILITHHSEALRICSEVHEIKRS